MIEAELGDGYLQYGVMTTLADGSRYCEEASSKLIAMRFAQTLTDSSPHLPPAVVVRRTVIEGPWEEGIVGDQWGVKRSWDDGYAEVEKCASRARAESMVRLTGPARETSAAVVVSRRFTIGEWVRDSPQG